MKFSEMNEDEQLEALCERFAFAINALDKVDYVTGMAYFSRMRDIIARELIESRECSINIQNDMIYITDRKAGDMYIYERNNHE